MEIGVLNVRVARAIQADEQLKKRCFACQSPDHFIRDCLQAKNGRRPPAAKGASKKQPGLSEWKGKDSILYAHSARALQECSSEVKNMKGKKVVPCLNPDAF